MKGVTIANFYFSPFGLLGLFLLLLLLLMLFLSLLLVLLSSWFLLRGIRGPAVMLSCRTQGYPHACAENRCDHGHPLE